MDLLPRFPDGLPNFLADELSDVEMAELEAAEGLALFHLFDATWKVSSWAGTAFQCGMDSARALIPGWKSDVVFSLEEEGDASMSNSPGKVRGC